MSKYIPTLDYRGSPDFDYIEFTSETGITYKVPDGTQKRCTSLCCNYYNTSEGYAHCALNGEHLPENGGIRTLACIAVFKAGKRCSLK